MLRVAQTKGEGLDEVEIACCIQTRINLGWFHRVYSVEWLAGIRLRSYPPVGTANVWPPVTNPRASAFILSVSEWVVPWNM